jgi:protein Mpv17
VGYWASCGPLRHLKCSRPVTEGLQSRGINEAYPLIRTSKLTMKQEEYTLNLVPIMHFVIFTLLSCPPNFAFQAYLEEKFPGYTLGIDGTRSLSKQNTARKLLLDQTLAAAINTFAFIAAMAAFKGKDRNTIMRECRRDVWPLMVNGWKVWPLVAIFNFTFVPVHRRIIVASIFGLFWGIYLSLFVAARPAPRPADRSGILAT